MFRNYVCDGFASVFSPQRGGFSTRTALQCFICAAVGQSRVDIAPSLSPKNFIYFSVIVKTYPLGYAGFMSDGDEYINL